MAETMRAAVLPGYQQPLEIRQVPVPQPGPGELLVRVAATGVCHSDLTLAAHEAPNDLPGFPWILGHETAGYVHELGQGTIGFEVGDAVAIHSGWGCGSCAMCRRGKEYLCAEEFLLQGVGSPGGFAEYLLVPNTRPIVKLNGLDPVLAAPLTDAGVTAYGAVAKLVPQLRPGTTAVVVGIGGVGTFALQYLRELTSARIIAVDLEASRKEHALAAGADEFVLASDTAGAEILALTEGAGATGLIDFVGSTTTTQQAREMIAVGGTIVMVGIGQGSVTVDWSMKPEVSVTTSYMASMDQFREVLALAKDRGILAEVVRYPLEDAQQAMEDLAAHRFTGRAVLIP